MTTTIISTDSLNGETLVPNSGETIVRSGVLLFNDGIAVELGEGASETVLINFGDILSSSSITPTIDMESAVSTVINHGTISLVTGNPSSSGGVLRLSGGNATGTTATDSRVVNYGLIESQNQMFDENSADGPYNVVVENFGIMRANRGVDFLGDDGDMNRVSISNSGTMVGGRLELDGNERAFLLNSGTIEMSALAINADLGGRLVNSGAITLTFFGLTGSLLGSTNAPQTIINSGSFVGNISVNSSQTIVRNTGQMEGFIDTGFGSDIVENLNGYMSSSISMGAGIDRLLNTATILGFVDMGEGIDTVINSGLIQSNVVMNLDNDTYRAIGDGAVAGGIFGGNGDDLLVGGNLSDSIEGGLDNDTLRGRDGDDSLVGGDGSDSILGDGGDDIIQGGSGIDTIRGGDGDDQIDGGTEADELFGNAGNDTILGGDGDDTIRAGAGDDSIEGGLGNNNMNGGLGNDTLVGDVGNDLMRGNDGNDNVAGADGADTLLGGEGNDTITGGQGRDVLNGGLGADQFRFTSVIDSGTGAARDLIQDFEVGTDLIVLSPLPGVLDFIGSGAFTGTGAEVRAVEISGGLNTLVQIDGNGDGSVDSEILLSFATGVTEDDFLL